MCSGMHQGRGSREARSTSGTRWCREEVQVEDEQGCRGCNNHHCRQDLGHQCRQGEKARANDRGACTPEVGSRNTSRREHRDCSTREEVRVPGGGGYSRRGRRQVDQRCKRVDAGRCSSRQPREQVQWQPRRWWCRSKSCRSQRGHRQRKAVQTRQGGVRRSRRRHRGRGGTGGGGGLGITCFITKLTV